MTPETEYKRLCALRDAARHDGVEAQDRYYLSIRCTMRLLDQVMAERAHMLASIPQLAEIANECCSRSDGHEEWLVQQFTRILTKTEPKG